MFVTIGNGYGGTMVVAEDTYNKRMKELHIAYLKADGDDFEWHEYAYLECEAELYEELLQKAIDEAEANC